MCRGRLPYLLKSKITNLDIHYLYEFLPCPTFLIYMLCLREIELFLRKHKNNQLGYSTILPLSCFDNQLGHCSLIPSPSQTTKLNICCVSVKLYFHIVFYRSPLDLIPVCIYTILIKSLYQLRAESLFRRFPLHCLFLRFHMPRRFIFFLAYFYI